jgi:hypothetical protein
MTTCVDNIKVAVSPLIVAGMALTAIWGGVSSCVLFGVETLGASCVAGAPLVAAGGAGLWGAYKTAERVWWGRGSRHRYHPLSNGHH